MNLSSGSRVGPYEILAPVGGAGDMVAYRARDARLKRVLKWLIAGKPGVDTEALSEPV